MKDLSPRVRLDATNTSFLLPYREWRRLYRRAYNAQQLNHSEVCGFFSADSNGHISLEFLTNRSDRPGHFELSSEELTRARRNVDVSARLIGIFHSHPLSEAVPGPADIKNSSYKLASLICDVCGRCARLWRIERKGRRKVATELRLEIQRSWRITKDGRRNRLPPPRLSIVRVLAGDAEHFHADSSLSVHTRES